MLFRSNAADRTDDVELKKELSFRAAALYENQIGEPHRAFRNYERVLSVDSENVQAAKALATQADLQLQMARGRYQAGVGNAIEMGDSAVAAASAQAQYIQAQYALYNARATLLWHLGQLIPGSRT